MKTSQLIEEVKKVAKEKGLVEQKLCDSYGIWVGIKEGKRVVVTVNSASFLVSVRAQDRIEFLGKRVPRTMKGVRSLPSL